MPISLFIADTDRAHIEKMVNLARRCPDIRVAGSCGNGEHALRQLSVSSADVLVTELQLPGLDGIMLLKELKRMRCCPTTIVCTQFYSNVCVNQISSLGADYCLYKPLDYDRLPEVIRACHADHVARAARVERRRAESGETRIEAIQAMLSELGIPARISGNLYLTLALSAAMREPSLLKNLSKGLYLEVAARTHSTPARLERAVRHAIAVACERGDLAKAMGRRPSNREFLMYLMEQLKLRCGQ